MPYHEQPEGPTLKDDSHSHHETQAAPAEPRDRGAPGKRTLTRDLSAPVQRSAATAAVGGNPSRSMSEFVPISCDLSFLDSIVAPPQAAPSSSGDGVPVQRKESGDVAEHDVHALAERGTSGGSGPLPFMDQIQASFGAHDVAGIKSHNDGNAADAARSMGATAFATADRVAFAGTPDLHTAAHEAAHIVQQRSGVSLKGGVGEAGDPYEQHADRVADAVARGDLAEPILDEMVAPSRGAGEGTVQRKAGGDKDKTGESPRNTFPWVGRVFKTELAALRKTPSKDRDDAHKNTLADIPRDTFVSVLEKKGGWLRVQVTVEGTELEGWISQELIYYYGPDSEDDVRHMPTMHEALQLLKRAEHDTKAREDKDRLDKAIEIVERGKRYVVDSSTFKVSFVTSNKKIEVASIEDFILFVETVERSYSSASAKEVATEVRQLWFSDSNWDVLVDGDGIMDGKKAVDIESQAPIADTFDMKNLAPSSEGKKIATIMGTVDIGHVMAGIDAALNGGVKNYPKERLKRRGADNGKSKFKHEKLNDLNDGDPRDFATWAGDIGQAYAEYIADRYVRGRKDDFASYLSDFASPDEILGDIHGYIALQAWKDTPGAASAGGSELKVSNVLRDLYLGDKDGKASGDSYLDKFQKVSGKAGQDLKNFVVVRAFSFAEPWYVKSVIDSAWAAALDGYDGLVREFNEQSDRNERNADRADTLDGLVDGFIRQLDGTVQ